MQTPINWNRLKKWFNSVKRELPWRGHSDPYAIWISEVMLQQTQVSVVIPYYLAWMHRFPTIRHLAAAPLDEVIKAWEGLGYYSRVRHLHAAAKELAANHNALLPDSEEALKHIKGLGPYTIGAILSFAFHKKKAAVDGNVIRVLTRYLGSEEDITKPSVIAHLRQLVQDWLPDDEPWTANEALIELGATICQRKARCSECPLKQNCNGYRLGIVDRLPYKSKKTIIEHLHRSVAVVRCGCSYLISRGKSGAVMSDLYEFPYFEISSGQFCPQALKEKIEGHYALKVVQKDVLPEISHGFTRYQAHLYPVLFHCKKQQAVEGLNWIASEDLKKLAFSSGHRRIFQHLTMS